MKKYRLSIVAAAFVALAPGSARASAPVVVIANPKAHVHTLDARSVRSVFLGRAGRIGDAQRVVVATLAGGATHERFLREFLDQTPNQFSRRWLRLVFSGKARKPRVFQSEADLAAFVAQTPGAVGYVSTDTPLEGVTVVRVER